MLNIQPVADRSWQPTRGSRLPPVAALVVGLALVGCRAVALPPNSAWDAHHLPDLTGASVEVIGEWSGTEQAAFTDVLHRFTALTHAKVTYDSGGNDINVLINSRLAGGRPPDVALIPEIGVAAQYAGRGAIEPLAGPAAGAVRANFSPAWQQLGTFDGKLYGFFYKVANKSTVWYRTDALAAAGVVPPDTWDQFLTVSATVADSGTTAMALPAADGWPATDWFENIYLRVAGVYRYNQLTQHRIPWTDPTVVEALRIWADYLTRPGFVERGATQLTFTQSVADVFGSAPKAAMLYEGDFVAGEIRKSGVVPVGGGARFFPFPSINGSPPSVVAGGDLALMFNDSTAAQALMTYLAGPEAAAIWAREGGFVSANLKLDAASAYPDRTTRAVADALLHPTQLVYDQSDQSPQAFGGQTAASEWSILTDFVRDPSDPERTAARLEAAAIEDYRSL